MQGRLRRAGAWPLLVLLCAACGPEPEPARRHAWRVALLRVDDDAVAAAAEAGLREGLEAGGLAAERDVTISVHSGHGDPAMVPRRAGEAVASGADLLVTVSTPALRSALRAAGGVPVIFTAAADPAAAGYRAASFWQRWLPMLVEPPRPPASGASAVTNGAAMLDVVAGVIGAPAPVGAVYGEDVDALAYRDMLTAAATARGWEVRTTPARTPADVTPAAAALCGEGVRAFVALGDRVTNAGFAALVAAAQGCRVPVFGVLAEHAPAGAAVTLARDIRGAGRTTGAIAARVLRGQDAATVPVTTIDGARIIINAGAADRAGVGLPLNLLQRAEQVLED